MKIHFSTLFVEIVVDGILDSNYRECLQVPVGGQPKERLFCHLIVDTIIAGSPKARGRKLNLTVSVMDDIRSIKEKNALSDPKHQVPIESLLIHRIDIDGNSLRIIWSFNDRADDPDSRRLIHGNLGKLWNSHTSIEDNEWIVYPNGNLTVAW